MPDPRTISDIIDACQEQRPATEEELRLALLSLFYALQMASPSDYERASELKLKLRAKENFERYFLLLKQTPQHWLGERWTPGTATNDAGRATSKRVLAALEKKKGGSDA